MVEAADMPEKSDDPEQVQQAAAAKLEKVRVKRANKN